MKHLNKSKTKWHRLGLVLLLAFITKFTSAQTTVTITSDLGLPSPVNLCKGTEMVLTANASCPLASGSSLFAFTWSGGPFTIVPNTGGQQIIVQPNNPTVYTVTAVPTFTIISNWDYHCPITSATFSVNVNPTQPTVSQMPDPICDNGPIQFTLNNLSPSTSLYNINWMIDYGNVNGPQSFSTTNPSDVITAGNFPLSVTFTNTDPNACSGSMPVIINHPLPCSNGTAYTQPNLVTMSNATISIINDVNVVGNIILNHCDISVSPTKKIIVKPGASLTISRSWLHGCVCPWEGIVLEGDAKLKVARATVIEDAVVAIGTKVSGLLPNIEITNSVINKCGTGVKINMASSGNMNSHIKVDKSIFTCRNLPSSGLYGNIPVFNSYYSYYFLTFDTNPTLNVSSLNNTIDNYATRAITLDGTRTKKGIEILNHKSATLTPFSLVASTEASMFDNMDYGIYAYISSISIVRPHFMNMEGNNVNEINGIGVYCIDPKNENPNSYCQVLESRFANVCRGVHTDGIIETEVSTSQFSSDQTYSNYNLPPKLPGQYGIYHQYSAATIAAAAAPVKWVVFSNTIRNFDIGTSIIRNTAFSGGSLTANSYNRFECNTIFGQNNGVGYCRIGFYMNDGVGSNGNGGIGPNPENSGGNTNMNGNDIVRCKSHAIKLEAVVQHTNITNSVNTFSGNSATGQSLIGLYSPLGLTLGDNTAKSSTILLNNCNNIFIEKNDVFGYYVQPGIHNTTGIFLNNSHARISDNKIERNQHNIQIIGQCNPSTIIMNQFLRATTAMFFSSDGQIGQQGFAGGPTGNKFALSGLTWQTNVANLVSNPNITSKFYYGSTTGAIYTEKMPNFSQTVSGGAPGINQYQNGTGLNQTTGEIEIYQPPNFCGISNEFPPHHPEPLIKTAADSLVHIKDLILDSLPLQAYAAQKWWRNKVEAYKMIDANPSAYMQDAVVQAFYNNNQNTSVGKLNLVYDYAQAGQTQMAESVNNTLVASDAVEDYRKAVNYVYLHRLNDSLYVPDSTDLTAMDIIANACPDEMGKVVYEARNILMSVKKQVLDFNDSCGAGSAGNRVLKINYPSTSIPNNFGAYVLFPNPNNGTFELKNSLGKNISGMISVIDIMGRIVLEQNIINEAAVSIDLTKENRTSGIYFVKLIGENNQVLYLGKTIVQ